MEEIKYKVVMVNQSYLNALFNAHHVLVLGNKYRIQKKERKEKGKRKD